jgi:hypothetical protein
MSDLCRSARLDWAFAASRFFNRLDSALLEETVEKFSVLLEESGKIGCAEQDRLLDPFFEIGARFVPGNYSGEVNGVSAGRARSTLGKTHRR